MKRDIFSSLSILLLLAGIAISCKKEKPYEGQMTQKNPPIAVAGPDRTITLPIDSISLDGTASKDPDGAISEWLWNKISGPASFNIAEPTKPKTVVTHLVPGAYQFELSVKDTNGLSGKDTTLVIVTEKSIQPPGCDNSNRPKIDVQLISIGSLSKSRVDIAVATAGTKVVFAGGLWTVDCPECWGSSRVDIYDTATQQWSTAELSKGRGGIGVVAAGNRIFFAGGRNGDGAFDQLFSEVDIYDAATGTWSVTQLSQPRAFIAAAATNDKAFFAGGEKDWSYNTSNVVDIYDFATNTWSAESLSEARSHISAVSINNQVYFAGGFREDRWYNQLSDKIDIYDNNIRTWHASSLIQPMGFPAGLAFNQNIYWASECNVEIRGINTASSSTANLFSPGEGRFDGLKAVIKSNKIIFMRQACSNGTDKFDIYDMLTGEWSIGVLPYKVYGATVAATNNTVYLAARTSGSCGQTTAPTRVWKLEF